ncbi:MAG: phosphatase PAP2 family protein [Anaerostipes sp.]|jgi:membrane-associated phospholipid phosphatase
MMKDNRVNLFGVIPKYAVIPLICSFLFNSLIYSGTMMLCKNLKHYDFTTGFDRMVPVIPSFVSIYLICYVFWIVNYILIGRVSKEHMYRFLVGDFLSRIICGMFFVLLPTTLVRPEIVGNGVWEHALRFVYSVDQSANLFPSVHCLVSWFCYIGIRGEKSVSKGYRIFSCVFAILVCVSTQVTKQHYVVDIAGGIFLAEICFQIGKRTQMYKKLEDIFTRVNQFVHLEPSREVGYEK